MFPFWSTGPSIGMKSPVQILGNPIPEPRPRNLGSNRERGHSNIVGNASQQESKTIPMAMARTRGSGGLPEQKSTDAEDMRGLNILMEAK